MCSSYFSELSRTEILLMNFVCVCVSSKMSFCKVIKQQKHSSSNSSGEFSTELLCTDFTAS